MADEGRVVIGGCTPIGPHPSHVCTDCDAEFIASDRVYRRGHSDAFVIGVAVWPHGRRSVRIEAIDEGWVALIAGKGSMLIDRSAIEVFIGGVFEDMWPWEVQEWVNRRGFAAEVGQSPDGGWQITVPDVAQLFELILIKAWWRNLGRSPVESALDGLTTWDSSPIWLPS